MSCRFTVTHFVIPNEARKQNPVLEFVVGNDEQYIMAFLSERMVSAEQWKQLAADCLNGVGEKVSWKSTNGTHYIQVHTNLVTFCSGCMQTTLPVSLVDCALVFSEAARITSEFNTASADSLIVSSEQSDIRFVLPQTNYGDIDRLYRLMGDWD